MNILKNTKLMVAAGVVVVIVVTLLVGVGKFNSLRNASVEKEAALVAQYMDNQNELSTYILQFRESMGVAGAGADKLESILIEAIKGRYDGKMEPGTGGSMFSAISEAYPDLTATTESYAKVQDLVVSGRNAYKNKQTKLLDMVRDYDTWREKGLVNSWIIRNWVGAPTERMSVNVGSEQYVGVAALDKMREIVLVQESIDAYDTGVIAPLIGGEETATPETEEE